MNDRYFTLAELCEHIDARLCGDSNHKITGIASLERAVASEISFITNKKYRSALATTRAGAVIIRSELSDEFTGNQLIVENPYLSYAKLSAIFDKRPRTDSGIHPSAVVADSARVHALASIGAHCTIGEHSQIGAGAEIYPGCFIGDNCVVGDCCLLHANVTLYRDVRLGKRVIIHSASVLGSDGFGFAPSTQGWEKIHQLGGVAVGNDVEIGSGVTIDRGALTDTEISDGVIIDNQVHLAHNVHIGKNTAIAGCTGVAGSTHIGKNCTIAGAVAINGHIEIADNSHIHGGTIVTKSIVEPGGYASTAPMMDVKKWRRASVRYTQLDAMAERIKALEKQQNP